MADAYSFGVLRFLISWTPLLHVSMGLKRYVQRCFVLLLHIKIAYCGFVVGSFSVVKLFIAHRSPPSPILHRYICICMYVPYIYPLITRSNSLTGLWILKLEMPTYWFIPYIIKTWRPEIPSLPSPWSSNTVSFPMKVILNIKSIIIGSGSVTEVEREDEVNFIRSSSSISNLRLMLSLPSTLQCTISQSDEY